MTQASPDLISRPCADLPEFLRFIQQDYRKRALLEQTGGGDAFVQAAMPVIRKQVIQALPYASPSSKLVHELQRSGIGAQTLDRALAQAWLDDAQQIWLPRSRRRDFFSSTLALLAYSVTASVFLMIELVAYLRHAHPELATMLLAFPPLIALGGVPIVLVLFVLLRKLFHTA